MNFKEYVNEAGGSAERQENAFVDAVNKAVEMNAGKPITVNTKDSAVKGVVKAEKFQGRQVSGSEPYTDVQLFTSKGILNLSMKGPAAPSLAGGGLRGIETVIPGLGARFYRAALDNHLKNGLKPGEKVPDTYAILNKNDKELLVIGNPSIGGPIDYMYIGPMNVKSTFKNGVLRVNGKLIPAARYAKEHELYFRLRARRGDQVFAPDRSKNGIPLIYSRSNHPKRDNQGRLVITDSKPKSSKFITF